MPETRLEVSKQGLLEAGSANMNSSSRDRERSIALPGIADSNIPTRAVCFPKHWIFDESAFTHIAAYHDEETSEIFGSIRRTGSIV
jgi:hypothetical protein